MEKIQTASEWLFLKMNVIRLEHDMGMLDDFGFIESQNGVFKKAKEMEKDQIMRAYMSGEIGEMYELKNTLTAKQYYENNYEKTN